MRLNLSSKMYLLSGLLYRIHSTIMLLSAHITSGPPSIRYSIEQTQSAFTRLIWSDWAAVDETSAPHREVSLSDDLIPPPPPNRAISQNLCVELDFTPSQARIRSQNPENKLKLPSSMLEMSPNQEALAPFSRCSGEQ